jgi:hypothetical protein
MIGPGDVGHPGLPIDNNLIFLFFAALIFGTYTHYKKIKKKGKANVKSSLN